MKKNILIKICLCLLIILISIAEIRAQEVCFNYKGSWSSWRNWAGYGKVSAYSDGSGLVLKTFGGMPYFDFQINNFVAPSKKMLKEAQKTDTWFEYKGTVEYYVNDQYPTAEDIAKHNTLVQPNPRTDVSPVVKRTASCTIKIAPYKKAPFLYFIIFDGIGIEISVKGYTFKGNEGFGGKKRE